MLWIKDQQSLDKVLRYHTNEGCHSQLLHCYHNPFQTFFWDLRPVLDVKGKITLRHIIERQKRETKRQSIGCLLVPVCLMRGPRMFVLSETIDRSPSWSAWDRCLSSRSRTAGVPSASHKSRYRLPTRRSRGRGQSLTTLRELSSR